MVKRAPKPKRRRKVTKEHRDRAVRLASFMGADHPGLVYPYGDRDLVRWDDDKPDDDPKDKS